MTESRSPFPPPPPKPRFPPPTGAPVGSTYPAGPGGHESVTQQSTGSGRADDHTRVGASAPAPPGGTLLARAKLGDENALATIFGQFLPRDETLLDSKYLGVLGLWGIGTHSFVAITPRRIATLQISFAGGVEYQDGLLEYINASAVFQPSRVRLYLTAISISLVLAVYGLLQLGPVGMVLFLLLSLVLLPFTVRLHYRFQKSGIVVWVREGMPLYAFIDRTHMRLANQLYRLASDAREDRLRVHRPS